MPSATEETTATTTKRGSARKTAAKTASKTARKHSKVAPPHVDRNAAPVEMRKVKKVTVITGTARYRGSEVAGTFELAVEHPPIYWNDGSLRAQVVALWFDWTPANGYPKFAFEDGAFEIIEDYSGEVVAKVGRAS